MAASRIDVSEEHPPVDLNNTRVGKDIVKHSDELER
jgi:hypothetical protein